MIDAAPVGARLPTFLVIGANRAGTTSLHHWLGQHPDVFMSALKEPSFFEVAHRGGAPLPPEHPFGADLVYTWDAYARLFAEAGSCLAVGECSTGYLASPQAPEAIHQALPDVRIVAVLRHPVDRAHSQYLMYRRAGLETIADFEAALDAEPQRLAGGWPQPYQYSQLSSYGACLARYYARFPRGQIRLHRYEQLRDQPAVLLRSLFAFVGVDPDVPVDQSQRLNATPESQRQEAALGEATRRRLAARFRTDLEQLDSLTGGDWSSWIDE